MSYSKGFRIYKGEFLTDLRKKWKNDAEYISIQFLALPTSLYIQFKWEELKIALVYILHLFPISL